jgi:hypothetical protein
VPFRIRRRPIADARPCRCNIAPSMVFHQAGLVTGFDSIRNPCA